MFSVRIDYAGGASREVLSCTRYRATFGEGTTLTLIGVAGQEAPVDVRLAQGDKAYVMNERGDTIDHVVPARRG